MAVQTQIQMRRGTASSWTSTNPTLAAGEIGFETDTGKIKIGTGSATWNALAYTASATASTYQYTATAGQTTFSGSDANGNTLAYTVGAEQVYLNGVLLVRGTDYTATNGTSVVLASGAVVSDILTVLAYSAFTVSSDIPKSTLSAKGSLVTATAASTPANLSVGTDGYQLVADSSQSTGLGWAGNAPAGKNGVINGGMDIWQRGTSFSYSAAVGYFADRWYGYCVPAGTFSRQATNDTTNLPNIQYCARIQRNSGNTSTGLIQISQSFESVNSYFLVGKLATLSFYARKGANYSEANSQISVGAQSGTGTDQNIQTGYTGASNFVSGVATLTTTWQRFTYTGQVSTSGTEIGVYFGFTPSGTAGAADYFEITGVQLELGSVATVFARAGGTIQGELAACQRYYQRFGGDIAYQYLGNGIANSTTSAYITIPPMVKMRTVPSSIDGGTLALYDAGTITAVTNTTLGAQNGMLQVACTVASGLTAQRPYFLVTNNSTSAYLGFSAEL